MNIIFQIPQIKTQGERLSLRGALFPLQARRVPRANAITPIPSPDAHARPQDPTPYGCRKIRPRCSSEKPTKRRLQEGDGKLRSPAGRLQIRPLKDE